MVNLFPFKLQMQGVVNFFGRISTLIDQNAQAFHMFMTALLQVSFIILCPFYSFLSYFVHLLILYQAHMAVWRLKFLN